MNPKVLSLIQVIIESIVSLISLKKRKRQRKEIS